MHHQRELGVRRTTARLLTIRHCEGPVARGPFGTSVPKGPCSFERLAFKQLQCIADYVRDRDAA